MQNTESNNSFRRFAGKIRVSVLLLVAVAAIVCGESTTMGALTVYTTNTMPIRVAQGPDGSIYATDTEAGAVFVYNESLSVIGQIKGISQPLGIAVNSDGLVYVGSQGSRNIQVYQSDGTVVRSFANGVVSKPNDMVHDLDGNLYVVDSLLDKVLVFDSLGHHTSDIGSYGSGPGQFDFPSAVDVAYYTNAVGAAVGELFVGDQRNLRIQVFDLQGNYLRSFGGEATFSMMRGSYKWQGNFVRLQSLRVDNQYRIHALDNQLTKIQILDAGNGNYIDSYGEFGSQPGELYMPLDILITQSFAGSNRVVVANAGNSRVEEIYSMAADGDVVLTGGAVSENSTTGTVAGGLSNNAFPASTVYMLVDGAGSESNSLFSIDSTNLLTAAALDHDDSSSQTVRIKGFNAMSRNLMFATRLTVQVSNVNEQPQGVALDDNEVLEEQPVGTVVGNLVTTDDDVADSHSYWLVAGAGDTDNASFSIVGNELQTAAVFDYEIKTNYSVRVLSIDGGSLFVESAISISVINIIESSGLVDRDVDGMPDIWEYSHSGSTTDMTGSADMDGDGVSNFDEWQAQTDPGNASDFAAIAGTVFNFR